MIRTSLIAQGKRRLVMSLLLSLLLAAIYAHLARFYAGRLDGWLLATGGVLVGLNVLRAGLGLAYRLDRLPFRTFDLVLADDRLRPGDALGLELVVETRRAAVLERVEARLVCTQERIEAGRRRRRVLETVRAEPVREETLAPGAARRWAVRLDLPPEAPVSFRDAEERLRWEVAIEVVVRDWGTLRDAFEVTVAPA